MVIVQAALPFVLSGEVLLYHIDFEAKKAVLDFDK